MAGLASGATARLYDRMAKEVERKFLVRDDGWRAAARAGASLRQFYVVAAPDRSVRVRIENGETAKLALKFGTQGHVRDEYELPLALADALEMERFALGLVIEKTRSLVEHRGRVFEVDEFSGALAGLVVAELESKEPCPDSALPAWLGREITGESAWYNASLALNGLPERAA